MSPSREDASGPRSANQDPSTASFCMVRGMREAALQGGRFDLDRFEFVHVKLSTRALVCPVNVAGGNANYPHGCPHQTLRVRTLRLG